MSVKARETEYGFEWGAAKIERGFSDDKKEWVTLLLTTKKYPRSMQIYVTKSGIVRVFDSNGVEWLPANERWKNRSRTLPGIAAAMAEQWSQLKS